MGGGELEAFAFGGSAPVRAGPDGFVDVLAPERPFGLCYLLGTATASNALFYDNLFGEWTPQQPTWAVGADRLAQRFNYGDAGPLYDHGLIALLLRKVASIVVFINTGTPLDLDYDLENSPTPEDLDATLPCISDIRSRDSSTITYFRRASTLVSSGCFRRRRRRGIVMASRRLRVLANDAWGTAEGEARVTWVYGERVPPWERLLRPEIHAAIAAGDRGYPTGPGPVGSHLPDDGAEHEWVYRPHTG